METNTYILFLEDCLRLADNLRAAQRAYLADRGNDKLGKMVAMAAEEYDMRRKDFIIQKEVLDEKTR